MSDDNEATFTSASSYRRQRRANGINPLVVLFLVLCVLTGVGVVGWGLYSGMKKEDQKPKDAVKAETPAPVAKQKSPTESVSPPAPKKPATKTTEGKKDDAEAAFRNAWEEARVRGEEADKAEPERTRKALALLTQQEFLDSGALIVKNDTLPDPGAFDRTLPAKLRGVGLSAWMDRKSRKIALEDSKFKTVVRALWEPRTGSDGPLAMMNVWGDFPRETRLLMEGAVTTGTPANQLQADVRNAILDLGGHAWLQR